MFNPDKIRSLLEEREISQVQFLKDTDISKSNLYVWLNSKSMPGADKLEVIADYFNVPIDYFFDRDILFDEQNANLGQQTKENGKNVSNNIALNECQKEIAYLKELLLEKERTIQILMNK